MSARASSLRTVLAIAAGLALAIAACGGDDAADVSTDPTTSVAPDTVPDDTGEATGAAEPAMQPASITFDAQDSDGTTITVASADLPAAGFIAVHGDGGGSPGPVIGVSGLLPAGVSSDVAITLDEPLDGDSTLFPMIHIDTNSNGVYEFGQVEGADGPGVTADGAVAVVGALVTVAGGDGTAEASSGDSGDAGGANTITIASFAFSGVAEVPVGTTVVVTNTDGTPHTWTAADGTFDSGAIEPGGTFEFTFTEAGQFDYHCNFHPSMTGTIVVTG
jgi:plastocyanin